MFAKFVSLSRGDHAQVKSFCEKICVKQSTPYSRDFKNNDQGPRRHGNNLVGKYGEVGAAKIIGGEVDFKVWSTGSRGHDQFETDIMAPTHRSFKGYNVHVKTCHAKYGIRKGDRLFPDSSASWTIDASDPVFRDPSPRDIIVLMFATDDGRVWGLGWVKASLLYHMWRPCKSVFLSHKRAVYYADIAKSVSSFL